VNLNTTSFGTILKVDIDTAMLGLLVFHSKVSTNAHLEFYNAADVALPDEDKRRWNY
jgi:hypothetical protein